MFFSLNLVIFHIHFWQSFNIVHGIVIIVCTYTQEDIRGMIKDRHDFNTRFSWCS
jgi:hypothetical protein